MVAVDDSETSAYAFTWALYNLIREHDHLVILSVALAPSVLPNPDLASGMFVCCFRITEEEKQNA